MRFCPAWKYFKPYGLLIKLYTHRHPGSWTVRVFIFSWGRYGDWAIKEPETWWWQGRGGFVGF
jgi:hypothetical protein